MRIDSHQHFWQLSRGDYGWLTPELGLIYRDFSADDLRPILQRHKIDATIVVQAAPWKGHDGICYVLLGIRAGCAPRGTVVMKPPFVGFTFDKRVVSGTALTFAGKRVPLIVRHFAKLDVTFFLPRGRLPRLVREATLSDANGKVIVRVRLKR